MGFAQGGLARRRGERVAETRAEPLEPPFDLGGGVLAHVPRTNARYAFAFAAAGFLASLASLAMAVNAAGSTTARSARILRSMPMLLVFRLPMRREYVVPFARAAALMRATHRR